jgi:Fe-S-cluster containining protein
MKDLAQFVSKEYCLGCRGCCRFAEKESLWQPHLLESEIPAIAPFSKKLEVIKNDAGEGFLCQFLNPKDNTCKIYTIRPFECRLYPFLLNRRGKKVYLAVDLQCPYIREAAALDAYKDYVSYLSEFFSDADVLQAVKNNPQIIQSYEEVLDIAQLKL